MTTLNSTANNRIGFHYFPDTAHYTNKDLNTFVPTLEKMGAKWLVLQSETSRAIPETFISGLIANEITPIIHFPLRLPDAPSAGDLKAILNAYARWGAKYVILFDRPNDRSAWSASGWSQSNLVENFLDRFLPLANECVNAGLIPVFPPLEPGGSYWDLSFLRTALLAMQRRGQKALLAKMVLSAYGFTFNHPLDWGIGGAQQWPQNKPYITPVDSQDQKGFRNFEWLEAVVQTVLGRSLPVFLLGLSQKSGKANDVPTDNERVQIVNSLLDFLNSTPSDEISSNILSGNFWLLASPEEDPASKFAWMDEAGNLLPISTLLTAVDGNGNLRATPATDKRPSATPTGKSVQPAIEHYLLLPLYEWGVADWHLEVIKPFILKHHPTVGFSIDEASLARKVTVIGGENTFTEEKLNELRSRGCEVERISGDGTTIATQLSER